MSKNQKALKLADELDAEFAQGRISNHTGRKAAQFIREALAEQPAQQQNPSEPIEFLSGFLTERLAIERGIEWTPAIHDLCNRAIEEEKLAEQPAISAGPITPAMMQGPTPEQKAKIVEAMLPAQQQEPVAWFDKKLNNVKWKDGLRNCDLADQQPLYTSPPASKPLTDEQIEKKFEEFAARYDTLGGEWQDMGANDYFKAGFKAAHGIKE